jgi:hypothetical protein
MTLWSLVARQRQLDAWIDSSIYRGAPAEKRRYVAFRRIVKPSLVRYFESHLVHLSRIGNGVSDLVSDCESPATTNPYR